jgi:CheY-like chemotaxis protein
MPAVLIVDDNIPVLDLLEKVLALASYDVFKACDGKQALDILRGKTIDAVLTDIAMPGMDGAELLRAIRENNLSVPVIAMSGDYDAYAAVEAGFDAFICKPFKISSVLDIVADTLKKRRKVLIVDDVLEMRGIVCLVVEQLGFRGIEAQNGAEALEILERQGADLIISDCSMPLIDGRDLLIEVKNRFPDLRVVVVSANFKPEDAEVLKPFGFLGKPYRLNDLKEIILKAMSQDAKAE